MDIDEKQVVDNIEQWFRQFEIYIPMNYRLQFGDWNKFKDDIEELVNEWNDADERAAAAEKEIEDADRDYNRVMRQVEKLKDYMSDIKWIDNPEHEDLVANITKQLEGIG